MDQTEADQLFHDNLNQFDLVCISLKSRPDRQARSKELFSELGILDRVHWWIVEKHPQGGMYGCFESHWLVWNASEFKRPYLCVFEDDLQMLPLSKERFYRSLNYAQEYLPSRFDILNLEPGQGYVNTQVAPELYSGGFLHLGCYIISRDSIPDVAPKVRKWFGIDVDTALYNNSRMGAILPKVFTQGTNDSDNGGGFREINFPLEQIFSQLVSLKNFSPLTGWIALQLAQGLSIYYLYTQSKHIEFQDRRLKENPERQK